MQLDDFKYSFLTLIILFNINHFLHTMKWFQVLLFNISDSIYQVFLCKMNNLLYGFARCTQPMEAVSTLSSLIKCIPWSPPLANEPATPECRATTELLVHIAHNWCQIKWFRMLCTVFAGFCGYDNSIYFIQYLYLKNLNKQTIVYKLFLLDRFVFCLMAYQLSQGIC